MILGLATVGVTAVAGLSLVSAFGLHFAPLSNYLPTEDQRKIIATALLQPGGSLVTHFAIEDRDRVKVIAIARGSSEAHLLLGEPFEFVVLLRDALNGRAVVDIQDVRVMERR